jgi:tRNA G18 (ribose-2'-O)-methylase SpoU
MDHAPGPTEWDQPGDDDHGVGPHPLPWPAGEHLDPELLAGGDRRNVIDRYRYWRREAIVADLDARRFPFEVAIENLGHDYNIGTIVRTANAFAAHRVHIVGRRRWNRRGAMVTDRYQHLVHHPDVDSLLRHTRESKLAVVAVDNLPQALPLETAVLPERSLLIFGTEGAGLSEPARNAADLAVAISQFGSTRSINVGVAAGIVMHRWICQHAAATSG